MKKKWVWSLGQEDPLQEEMATHSSILAWKNPMNKETGGLQSMKSQRVGRDRACTHAGMWAFFVRFLITDSISLLYLVRLSISSWFRLGRLYVSRNLSISFRLSNLLVFFILFTSFYKQKFLILRDIIYHSFILWILPLLSSLRTFAWP